MQRLAEQRQIDRSRRDRRVFEIAESIFEILKPVLLRKRRAELDHLFRIIDADHLLRAAREQLRNGPFSSAKIRDHQIRRHQREQQVRETVPRAPGTISAAKFSRQLIEIFACLIARFFSSKRECLLVRARLRAARARWPLQAPDRAGQAQAPSRARSKYSSPRADRGPGRACRNWAR